MMRRVKVDWSEYLRKVIKAKIKEELAKELDEIKGRARNVPTEVLVRWLREEKEKR